MHRKAQTAAVARSVLVVKFLLNAWYQVFEIRQS